MDNRIPKLYTVAETAKLFHVNRNTVYKLIDSGLLPALKLGSLKILGTALDEFLEKYNGYDLSDFNDIREIVPQAGE